jgi:hypothetical protein
MRFQPLMEGGFERFGSGFKSHFKFPNLLFPDEEGRAHDCVLPD